jgi:hypothetical protein
MSRNEARMDLRMNETLRAYNDHTGVAPPFTSRCVAHIANETVSGQEAIEIAEIIGGYNSFTPDTMREVVRRVEKIDPDAVYRAGRSGSIEWFIETDSPWDVAAILNDCCELVELQTKREVHQIKSGRRHGSCHHAAEEVTVPDLEDSPELLVRIWWD